MNLPVKNDGNFSGKKKKIRKKRCEMQEIILDFHGAFCVREKI